MIVFISLLYKEQSIKKIAIATVEKWAKTMNVHIVK